MEASTISPEWHQWVHHVVDEIPTTSTVAAFKPHYARTRVQNMTGTENAYSSPHFVGNKAYSPVKRKTQAWDPNTSANETSL